MMNMLMKMMNKPRIAIHSLCDRLAFSRASTSFWQLNSNQRVVANVWFGLAIWLPRSTVHCSVCFPGLFFGPRPILSSPPWLLDTNIDLSKLWDPLADSQDECILLIMSKTISHLHRSSGAAISGEINQQFLRLAKFPPNCDWLYSLLSPCVFCG